MIVLVNTTINFLNSFITRLMSEVRYISSIVYFVMKNDEIFILMYYYICKRNIDFETLLLYFTLKKKYNLLFRELFNLND